MNDLICIHAHLTCAINPQKSSSNVSLPKKIFVRPFLEGKNTRLETYGGVYQYVCSIPTVVAIGVYMYNACVIQFWQQ